MFIDATVPNSFKILLSVKMKVANPHAVVMLVIRVALPIFEITLWRERAWFPCFLTSCWYLFIKKIQFGTPITIIKGGISAVKTVISNSSRPSIPKAHITPVTTTLRVINVARYDLKKKKNINIVTNMAIITNFPISSIMFWAFMVLI